MRAYNQITTLFVCFFILMLQACKTEDQLSIDLSGQWNFKIDSLDRGLTERWFETGFSETINLPGSMAENGKGDDITLNTHWTGNMWNDSLWYKDPKMEKYRQKDNVKVPFWLSPEKVYTGPAWYQKKVNIPKSWENKHINLELERVHWESIVWIDNKKVGLANSLATAHNYNLGKFLTPGDHTITVRVDNRIKDINVGLDAHSVSDNTQTNWNGIIGDMELTATSSIHISYVKLYPDVANNKVSVVAKIVNSQNSNQDCELQLVVKSKTDALVTLKKVIENVSLATNEEIRIEFPMGNNPLLWDEFNPNLYEMMVTVQSSAGTDTKSVDFGMRDFKANGTIFTINDRPVFLRGTLECAIFPLTGYPPTDVDAWKRIFKIIKNHGLNHMRFHSWCPPKAAFRAADELGVYLQVEASAWTTIGDGEPIDTWLYKEAEDIINAYGNHPSFVMMAYGNEPGGKNHKKYLTKFVDHFKSLDNRRVYTGAAGWPYIQNLDFYNNRKPRIQGWNENLSSIINAKPPQTLFDYTDIINEIPMPYVSHEIGQWCVYPNFKEMSKYTGVLKPKNFEIFKETLEKNHLGKLADSLLLASGKLQTICYKADIEAALRTKGFGGFQLLDLHDFPGQGTALVGVLDAFWDEKGYVTPEEYREFCNQTVPLVRLEKRIFKNTETLQASIEVAHYGEKPLDEISPTWELNDAEGNTIDRGQLDTTNIPIGNGFQLGKLNIELDHIKKATQLNLTITISEFKNSWDVWVYPGNPKPIVDENDIKVVTNLDEDTINYLQNGGKVLLNSNKGDIVQDKGGDIGIGFSSIFWNTSWTKEQKPHTLGILCDSKHPAFQNFPTQFHSNWQWWDAMSHSNAMVLDDFSLDLQPIVRIIDDWFKNRRTALIFEAKVGKGKMIMSGIDLHSDLDNRIAAKQLLYSLKNYMTSPEFNPKTELKITEIQSLLK